MCRARRPVPSQSRHPSSESNSPAPSQRGQGINEWIVPKIDPKILDQRVEARLRRQQLLEQPRPPRFRELLDEAALCRQIGGSAVMHAQLGRILQLVREDKVTVQVIPFDAGAHASEDSNFALLEFGNPSIPDLVFVEGLVSHLYHERRDELQRYREALEYLRDAALSPRASVDRIAEISTMHQTNQK